jgi:hypothetical protein
VIDPIVAVTIAIVILQEAAQAGPVEILAFIGAGIISVIGVFLLARHHPQTHQAGNEVSKSPESSQKRP